MHLRPLSIPFGSDSGWQSQGGATDKHPCRGLPSSLTIAVPKDRFVTKIHFLGVFALFSNGDPKGGRGAVIQFFKGSTAVHTIELIRNRHYRDAHESELLENFFGDGSSIETVGCVFLDSTRVRLDILTVEAPPEISFDQIVFKDLGLASSFVIYDVAFECPRANKCPFHSSSHGIPLSELGAIVRLRDRVRFQKAMQQVHAAFEKSADLDEVRSEALTFLAIVTAGMLEAGGSRSLHKIQLEAARGFDKCQSVEEIEAMSTEMIHRIVGDWLNTDEVQPRIVEKALSVVDRHFAANISDDVVANQVGLSTSHFRYLFKQAVGKPFHQYLIATRLEKAKVMLESGQGSVSEIANAVGFSGLASFSRAFTQRFGTSPSEFKKVRGL
ncbi:MAG: helix-turn-helix transcriptional regulator [Armatimonadetes bacterium]|nr:helix-turn-helix transcriptional regulator [Armatimonadota bacterium]